MKKNVKKNVKRYIKREKWVKILASMPDCRLSKLRDRLTAPVCLSDMRLEAIAYMMAEYKRRGHSATRLLQPLSRKKF